MLAIEKIGDWKKLEILVQNQSFWNFCRCTTAPRNSGKDNAAGIIIVWWTSPPLLLKMHSHHQVATGTPFHVTPRRCGIIIAIFQDFGTNCMVLLDWDSALTCVCGPNFISDLIGESPIFLAAIMLILSVMFEFSDKSWHFGAKYLNFGTKFKYKPKIQIFGAKISRCVAQFKHHRQISIQTKICTTKNLPLFTRKTPKPAKLTYPPSLVCWFVY